MEATLETIVEWKKSPLACAGLVIHALEELLTRVEQDIANVRGNNAMKSKKVLSKDMAAHYALSDENAREQARRIAEMEQDGRKVVRRDDMDCQAALITPEVVHLQTNAPHGYYPNAVADLYAAWQKEQAQKIGRVDPTLDIPINWDGAKW